MANCRRNHHDCMHLGCYDKDACEDEKAGKRAWAVKR